MNTVEDHLEACNFPLSQVHINVFRPSLSMIRNAVKDQSTTKSL
jgi:ferredoxin-NADP reductase